MPGPARSARLSASVVAITVSFQQSPRDDGTTMNGNHTQNAEIKRPRRRAARLYRRSLVLVLRAGRLFGGADGGFNADSRKVYPAGARKRRIDGGLKSLRAHGKLGHCGGPSLALRMTLQKAITSRSVFALAPGS